MIRSGDYYHFDGDPEAEDTEEEDTRSVATMEASSVVESSAAPHSTASRPVRLLSTTQSERTPSQAVSPRRSRVEPSQ